MSISTSNNMETKCTKCLEQKRLYADNNELNLHELLEPDDSVNIEASKQQYQNKFQILLANLEATLKDKDDSTYSNSTIQFSFYSKLANFIEFIQDIFSKGESLELDDISNGLLKRLIQSLKTNQEADINNNTRGSNNCSDVSYKTNLRLMEKEISSLKDKLKRTQTELDKFKLKLKLNTTTQTNDSFWTLSNTNSSYLSNNKASSSTLTNSNDQCCSSISSLLPSNETGVETGSCGSVKANDSLLDNDFDLLSNLKVDKLRIKINEQTKLLKEIVRALNYKIEEKLDSQVALSLPSLVKPEKLFKCPKCENSLEENILTQNQIDHHLKNCNENKLVCIFCLKLYDKTEDEQIDYETHLQKHVTQLFLTKSSPVVISNDELICLEEKSSENKVEVLDVSTDQMKAQYKISNGEKYEAVTTQKKSEPEISDILTFSKAGAKPRKRL